MAYRAGLKKEVRKPKVKLPDDWKDIEEGQVNVKPEASENRKAPSTTPFPGDPGELSKQELEDLISGISPPPPDVEMTSAPPLTDGIPTNILSMYRAMTPVFQQAIEKSDFRVLGTQIQRCNKFITGHNQDNGRPEAEYTFPQERVLNMLKDIAELSAMHKKASPGDKTMAQRYAKCRAQWRTDLDDDKMWDTIFVTILPHVEAPESADDGLFFAEQKPNNGLPAQYEKDIDEEGLVKSSYQKGWALGREIVGFKKIGFGHQLLLKSATKPPEYELVPASQCGRSALKEYQASLGAVDLQASASIRKDICYEDLVGLKGIAYSSTTKERKGDSAKPTLIFVKWNDGQQWVTRSALQKALSVKIVEHEIDVHEHAICKALGRL